MTLGGKSIHIDFINHFTGIGIKHDEMRAHDEPERTRVRLVLSMNGHLSFLFSYRSPFACSITGWCVCRVTNLTSRSAVNNGARSRLPGFLCSLLLSTISSHISPDCILRRIALTPNYHINAIQSHTLKTVSLIDTHQYAVSHIFGIGIRRVWSWIERTLVLI